MTIAPLVSIAGAAAGSLAVAAVQALDNLSFLQVFSQADEAKPAGDPSNGLSLASFKQEAQGRLAKFHELLTPRLADIGVALVQPLTLALDALGGIREVSGHPQGAQVEQLLASDQHLADLFREAAMQLEALKQAEDQQRFATLYAQHPDLATAQYGHLFGDRRAQLSAQVTAERIEASFN